MLRRIIAALAGAIVITAPAVALPATASWAAPEPTANIIIGCGPNWGDCQGGYYYGGEWPEGTTGQLTWWVKNAGSSTVTVTPSPGASGCAQNAFPYPGPITLTPGYTQWFHTYVYGLCDGSGYAYASVYPASGRQRVYFSMVCNLVATTRSSRL